MKIVPPTFSRKMRCYILETPWTNQRVYKTGVGANKTRKAPRVGANSLSVFAFDMHHK